jgi:hypothetical protein
MDILTVRPKQMPQNVWRRYNKDLRDHIKRRISRPIWFAKGVPHRDINGIVFGKWYIFPMGTYRAGMQTL